jgi:Family of unknown function (DUF6491)
MKRILYGIIFAGLAVAGVPGSVLAGDPAEKQGGVNCISLSRIQSTEVIDKQHILFRLAGKNLYVNTLPRACPGLMRDKAYMYRTSQSQLCNLDMITVLDQMPFGLTAGASCGLGTFEPIDEEGVKELQAEAKANW